MKFTKCLIGCYAGGIEVEVEEGGDETEETVTFPSQGHPIQFDDPNYDPYSDGRPFNTTPQRSPVPEYTQNKVLSSEVTELDDGFINLCDPENKEYAETLKQQNTSISTDSIHLSVQLKYAPFPIEVHVLNGDSEIPGCLERRTEVKSIDPDSDPRQYQELDLNNCDISDIDSPRKIQPEQEVDPPPEKRLSRFKRFKRFVRSLCCCFCDSKSMKDVTTVHVFRTDCEAEVTCRAIRDLRIRRKSCYLWKD